MISRNEGAANRQVTRSNARTAYRRQARPSIAAWADEGEWSTGTTIAVIAIGAIFLYALMFLAAAY